MNYRIIGRYIKNLKFEIPNPKAFFLLEPRWYSTFLFRDIETCVFDVLKKEDSKFS